MFLIVGAAAVGAMYFIHQGDWMLAAGLFMLANIGANGSFVFYDAMLPHIAGPEEVDRVSTAGYALGYVGGGLLLALNLAWISKPAWFGLPSGPRLVDVPGHPPRAVEFLVSRRLVAGVLDPAVPHGPEPPIDGYHAHRSVHPMREAFVRLAETFRELRKYRQGS